MHLGVSYEPFSRLKSPPFHSSGISRPSAHLYILPRNTVQPPIHNASTTKRLLILPSFSPVATNDSSMPARHERERSSELYGCGMGPRYAAPITTSHQPHLIDKLGWAPWCVLLCTCTTASHKMHKTMLKKNPFRFLGKIRVFFAEGSQNRSINPSTERRY